MRKCNYQLHIKIQIQFLGEYLYLQILITSFVLFKKKKNKLTSTHLKQYFFLLKFDVGETYGVFFVMIDRHWKSMSMKKNIEQFLNIVNFVIIFANILITNIFLNTFL